jgi:hypothetical protein
VLVAVVVLVSGHCGYELLRLLLLVVVVVPLLLLLSCAAAGADTELPIAHMPDADGWSHLQTSTPHNALPKVEESYMLGTTQPALCIKYNPLLVLQQI